MKKFQAITVKQLYDKYIARLSSLSDKQAVDGKEMFIRYLNDTFLRLRELKNGGMFNFMIKEYPLEITADEQEYFLPSNFNKMATQLYYGSTKIDYSKNIHSDRTKLLEQNKYNVTGNLLTFTELEDFCEICEITNYVLIKYYGFFPRVDCMEDQIDFPIRSKLELEDYIFESILSMGLKETNPTRVAISQSVLLKSDTHTQEVVATSSVARISKYINRF